MNRRWMFPHLFAVFCFAAQCEADDYAQWARSATLFMDTSPNGANVAAAVTGFPILVRLTAATFPFPQARGKGQDIRFSETNGAHLNYEIERWDSAAGLADIWVKMNVIQGNTAGQTLRMYWGHAASGDSSNAALTFNNGYYGAWHLNTPGTAVRPNAVAGAPAATPANYDGNESTPGMIARADSLDGTATGDYLNIGDGYADFTGGFSFSAWVYPTAIKRWSKFIDLGNGPAADRIHFGREDATANTWFGYNTPAANPAWYFDNVLALNQWQHLAVTLLGSTIHIYRNGVLLETGDFGASIATVHRAANFLGKSNAVADEYYQGKLDQPELSRIVRSPSWIKLAYENQKANQTFLSFQPIDSNTCVSKFAVSADTTVSEGGRLDLTGVAECTLGYSWSAVSGPTPRIVDPVVTVLQIAVPRIAKDTVMVYRFTARFKDSTRSKDVRVQVKEAIPDPVFTFPAIPAWNGRDSLVVTPDITNLAAVKASPDTVIRYLWTLTDLDADTAWLPGALLLKGAAETGTLIVRLCMDNGGTPACRNVSILVEPTAGLRPVSAVPALPGREGHYRDPTGRRVRPGNRFPGRSIPVFPLSP